LHAVSVLVALEFHAITLILYKIIELFRLPIYYRIIFHNSYSLIFTLRSL